MATYDQILGGGTVCFFPPPKLLTYSFLKVVVLRDWSRLFTAHSDQAPFISGTLNKQVRERYFQRQP